MNTRTETDSLGSIEIDAERYWGPQTERVRRLFRIGTEVFPPGLIRAVGLQKLAAAEANLQLGELPREIAEPIIAAAREIADNRMDAEFPLPVWRPLRHADQHDGNEVIANRANELCCGDRGAREPVHPNFHVNRGQSSNDSFPTVMHIAAVEAVERLIPALATLRDSLGVRAQQWQDIVKVGRTHMMDAVPVTLGQEFGAWARQVGGNCSSSRSTPSTAPCPTRCGASCCASSNGLTGSLTRHVQEHRAGARRRPDAGSSL
jgi:fumarate hydratase class II